MKIILRAIAAAQILLVAPALFFFAALFARNLQPPQFEPARSAHRIVDWYAAHRFLALDIFLIALPFMVFLIGLATLIRGWRKDAALRQGAQILLQSLRAHAAPLLIAAATLAAGGALAIVALHMVTD